MQRRLGGDDEDFMKMYKTLDIENGESVCFLSREL